MGGPNGDVIFQQQLDPTEHTAVEELHNWLIANPNAEWKESPRFKLVEQCSEARLREILQLLAQVCRFVTINLGTRANYYRIPASLHSELHTQGWN